MRHFHLTKQKYHCPIINLDKLWTLVGEEVRTAELLECTQLLHLVEQAAASPRALAAGGRSA